MSEHAEGTVTARVAHPETVAAAVSPDDTDQLRTRVEDGAVVTTVRRPTVRGLRSTLDDVLVNLRVADTVAQLPDRHPSHTHE